MASPRRAILNPILGWKTNWWLSILVANPTSCTAVCPLPLFAQNVYLDKHAHLFLSTQRFVTKLALLTFLLTWCKTQWWGCLLVVIRKLKTATTTAASTSQIYVFNDVEQQFARTFYVCILFEAVLVVSTCEMSCFVVVLTTWGLHDKFLTFPFNLQTTPTNLFSR